MKHSQCSWGPGPRSPWVVEEGVAWAGREAALQTQNKTRYWVPCLLLHSATIGIALHACIHAHRMYSAAAWPDVRHISSHKLHSPGGPMQRPHVSGQLLTMKLNSKDSAMHEPVQKRHQSKQVLTNMTIALMCGKRFQHAAYIFVQHATAAATATAPHPAACVRSTTQRSQSRGWAVAETVGHVVRWAAWG